MALYMGDDVLVAEEPYAGMNIERYRTSKDRKAPGCLALPEPSTTLCGRPKAHMVPVTDSAGVEVYVDIDHFVRGALYIGHCQSCMEHPDYPLLVLADV